MSHQGDLQVERLSDALASRVLDVVVSGSIGAVESVRFIRALRRLGADVTPWLTAGGARFVTPLAVAWAAGREARTAFQGDASHIALGDACVVAPASASLIAKAAQGLTDSPAAALIQSYLGQQRPVLLVPNMHDSLADAPAVRRNLAQLRLDGVTLLGARIEEGKRKFPDPATLADHVAHALNLARAGGRKVLVTMGSTRGDIDDVRYVSNYSSGALGSQVTEELWRLGYDVRVVAGPSPLRPRVYGTLAETRTNDEMQAAAAAELAGGAEAAIFAASVLDFTPASKASGKLSSRDAETLTVDLKRTRKIIGALTPKSGVKVGFKLETGLTPEKTRALAERDVAAYGLSLMVLNDLADVDATRHVATLVEGEQGRAGPARRVEGKSAVAAAVAAHVDRRLRGAADTAAAASARPARPEA